ncbi:MAG: tetratricopeptide repeat protein [Acidobacteriota bacterium]
MRSIRRYSAVLILALVSICSTAGGAQEPTPTPAEVAPEQKEQAYTKLMEGQRLLWKTTRTRSGSANNAINARAAFRRAVELDPDLAEAYTAMAEIALSLPPGDVENAILLATLAVKIDHDNFGSHRILARLFTFKSRFNSGSLDPAFADKAIAEWKQVSRLDPRNAEAWAFLSEYYSQAGRASDQIDALRKWIASATPVEMQFYRQAMGGRGDLSPETASIKLGTALISAGKADEAVEVLSAVVSDSPDNAEAVDLLREALETAGPKAVSIALVSIEQAVYADPANSALVGLLSQAHLRAGHPDQAVRVLREAAEHSEKTDKGIASQFQMQVGDVYASTDKVSEAIAAYEKALSKRGIKENQAVADADREFVIQVFEKMIKTYKSANRLADARVAIERARKLLGKDDLFADRQTIDFYRETGRRTDALAIVRTIRAKRPGDYGLLRLEASVLTEAGQVDDGVALINALIAKPPANVLRPLIGNNLKAPTANYDDFTNWLFISHLYAAAGRENEATNAANQAFSVAGSDERRQLAKMSLASVQQMAKDYAGAEATLRAILKQTPGNPIALNNLGYFLLERNERTTEALDLIRKALKVDPTNPSYLDSLGWAHFMLGNFVEAEKNLRSAARMDPSSVTIHEHLGDVYGKEGQSDKARSSWQRALTLAITSDDVSRLRSKLKK